MTVHAGNEARSLETTWRTRSLAFPAMGLAPRSWARRVLEATGVAFQWEFHDIGQAVLERTGTPLPDSVIESVRRTGVAFKGPVGTPSGTGFRSATVAL